MVCSLSIGISNAAPIDLDGDGLADAWELRFNAQSVLANGDEDLDGVSNLKECQAGTNPFERESYFQFAETTVEDGALTATWDSVIGKQYAMDLSQDLVTWNRIPVWMSGSGGQSQAVVAPSLKQFVVGSAVMEHYDLTDGSSWQLERLRRDANYLANTPNETYVMSELAHPGFAIDRDLYGTRIRAYLIPPTTGEYEFHLVSDDQSELFLSTDATPANKVKIAEVPRWTGPNDWTKYPEQHSIPISLEAGKIYYLEFEHFEGGSGDYFTVAWNGPGISFSTIQGDVLAPYDAESPSYFEEGQTTFVRLFVEDEDKDKDGVSDYDEHLLGFSRSTPSTRGGLSDAEAITLALQSENTVTVSVADPVASESGGDAGGIYVRRSGGLDPITVNLRTVGSASASDYSALPSSVSFDLGQLSVLVPVMAVPDVFIENEETVGLEVLAGTGYEIGSGDTEAIVMIEDAPVVHYQGFLSPSQEGGASVTTLAAAEIFYAERGNRTGATVSATVRNLSSAFVRYEVLYQPLSGEPVTVFSFTDSGAPVFFDYETAPGVSQTDIQQALDDGRLSLRVLTTGNLAGELVGVIRPQSGLVNENPNPATPPELDFPTITDSQAVRFLSQVSFGATPADVSSVQALGFEGWIDQQMDAAQVPPSLNYPTLSAIDDIERRHRQYEWYENVLEGPDQLRQRVAFALSQIFVVSEQNSNLRSRQAELGYYYDHFVNGSFGNYRDLLEEVTLSPVMGVYLSHLRNMKADPYRGIDPDENYAREIMQLFSIGLNELYLDGTLKRDEEGNPYPTYNQETIVEMAKVFTGWSYYTEDVTDTSFRYGISDHINRMVNWPEYHENSAKTIVGGVTLPAEQGAQADLEQTLDVLFNHPNTAPFICRLLIQRLVTSNPSPGYIHRVASVFEDNGAGERGDLGAVVKAILLDFEARSDSLVNLSGYGKVHEPIIRFTRVLRSLGAQRSLEGWPFAYEENYIAQGPLQAPSVFNFFLPDYAQSGEVAEGRLVSPELQIISESTLISANNRLADLIEINGLFHWNPNQNILLDYPNFLSIYQTPDTGPDDLLNYLDLYLCSGQMPAAMRTEILNAMTLSNHWDASLLDSFKVEVALWLTATSAQSAIQK